MNFVLWWWPSWISDWHEKKKTLQGNIEWLFKHSLISQVCNLWSIFQYVKILTCSGGYLEFWSTHQKKTHKSKEHSNQVCIQMIQWFQTRIIYFCHRILLCAAWRCMTKNTFFLINFVSRTFKTWKSELHMIHWNWLVV